MIYALGGLGEFGHRICQLPASSLTVPGTTGFWQWPMIFTVCLLSSSGAMVQPAQWMRYYAARNPKTLRRAAVIFAVVLPACFIFGVMIVGVGGQVIYPLQYDDAGALADANKLLGENKYDQILIVFLKEQLPELLGTLGVMVASVVIVAIMAASMSTADSSLHALSAVATRDMYDPFIRPSAGQRERVWIGRLVIVLATVFAVVIVVADEWRLRASGQQYEFMKHIAILGLVAISFSAQLLPLTIDILFLRRGTKAGAIAGLTIGLAAAFFFGGLFQPVLEALQPAPESALASFNSLLGQLKSAAPVHASAWGLLFNVPVFVLVSFITPKLPGPHRAEFGELAIGRRR